MNLDGALQTFVVESHEMLDRMEQALLSLEERPGDADLVNEIFRAAHTIKGSAGLFGLDEIVAFTHEVETLLDRIRDGDVAVDNECVAVLLACKDYIDRMIDPVASGHGLGAVEGIAGEQLLVQVRALSGATPKAVPATPQDEPAPARIEQDALWSISLKFGRDVLRDGMDPLSFLRYLLTMGEIVTLRMDADRMPSLAEMDPESCYLDFDIEYRSGATQKEIESAFDFVRESCGIEITPPRSASDSGNDSANAPGSPVPRLGELSVETGQASRDHIGQVLAFQAVAADRPRSGEILNESSVVQPDAVTAAHERQDQLRDRKLSGTETRQIRVDADKLDQLIDLVGELVISGATTQTAAHRAGVPELSESAAVLLNLVEQVRDRALSLRMVEVGSLFQRFQRVVRDVSRDLGKEIDLVINGGETELDKSMVEKLSDPLMHLVRNALDHGIKDPEYRIARGKPRRGTLTLSAYHDSGSVVIDIVDDGAGINRKKVLARAIERGLVQTGTPLSDHEIDQLIFAPGFSTADQVSNISGRGVGMDVVKRNIEAMRGTIEVFSRPDNGEIVAGGGTTMRIRLPLTLAIIDGFLVGVSTSRFIVPLDMIIECLKCPMDIDMAVSSRGYIDLRGEVLPIVGIRHLFRIEGGPARRQNIVVVRFGDKKVGLIVDDLLGEQQTVIKPLGSMFESLRGISGSTILGSGEVALIMDIPQLLKMVAAENDAKPPMTVCSSLAAA